MNYKKYKILKFIKRCPDAGIPKVVIHNALNISNIELDKILCDLTNDNLVTILKYKKDTLYSINFNGFDYMQNYPKLIFKALFEKYLFPILLSIITFALGYILG